MSNYLSTLVARTMETASVVQPRPLSTYEPVGRIRQTQPLHEEVETAGEHLPPWPTMPQRQALPEAREITGEDWPAHSSVPVAPRHPPTRGDHRARQPPIAPGPAEPRARQPSEPTVAPVGRSTVRPVTPPEPPLPLVETPTVRPAGLPDQPLPPVGRPATERPDILSEEGVKPAVAVAVPPQPKPVRTDGAPDVTEQERPDAANPVFRPLLIERLVARETVVPPTDRRMTPAAAGRSGTQSIIHASMAPAPAGSRPVTPMAGPPRQNPDAPVELIEPATFVPQPNMPGQPQVESEAAIAATPNQQPTLEQAIRSPTLPSRPITATVVTPALPEIGRGDSRPPGVEARPRPTIQVHIGRIEVRATPPTPPAQKQRPKPPVMSLDDYLRRRNGQGKRDE